MAQMAVADLKAGMIANEAISDKAGRVLIDAGSILTDKHIRVLKTWGVSSIDISTGATTNSTNAAKPSKEVMIRQAAQKIQPRFLFNKSDHPMTKALYLQCVLRVAQGDR